MCVFLEETTRKNDTLEQPILNSNGSDEDNQMASKKARIIGKIPSPRVIYRLLKSRQDFVTSLLSDHYCHFAIIVRQTQPII